MTTDATDFTLQFTTAHGEPVVAVTGDIDLATVGTLRSRLHSVIEHSDGEVVLDLSDVSYIDSTGLSALLEARDLLERGARTLVLADPSVAVTTILKLCGLTDHIRVRFGDARPALSVQTADS